MRSAERILEELMTSIKYSPVSHSNPTAAHPKATVAGKLASGSGPHNAAFCQTHDMKLPDGLVERQKAAFHSIFNRLQNLGDTLSESAFRAKSACNEESFQLLHSLSQEAERVLNSFTRFSFSVLPPLKNDDDIHCDISTQPLEAYEEELIGKITEMLAFMSTLEAENQKLHEKLHTEKTAAGTITALQVENQRLREELNGKATAELQEGNSEKDSQEELDEQQQETLRQSQEKPQQDSGELSSEPAEDSKPRRSAATAARVNIAKTTAAGEEVESSRKRAKSGKSSKAITDNAPSASEIISFVATVSDANYKDQCTTFVTDLRDMVTIRNSKTHCIFAAKAPVAHGWNRTAIALMKRQCGGLGPITKKLLDAQHCNQAILMDLTGIMIDYSGSMNQIIRAAQAVQQQGNENAGFMDEAFRALCEIDSKLKKKNEKRQMTLNEKKTELEKVLPANRVQATWIESSGKLSSADRVCSALMVGDVLDGDELENAQALCNDQDVVTLVVSDFLAILHKIIVPALNAMDRETMLAAVRVVLNLIEGIMSGKGRGKALRLFYDAQNFSARLGVVLPPLPGDDGDGALFVRSNFTRDDDQRRRTRAALVFRMVPILEEVIEYIFASCGYKVEGIGEMLLHMPSTFVAEKCYFLTNINFYEAEPGSQSAKEKKRMKEMIQKAIGGKQCGGPRKAYANMYQFVDISKQRLPDDGDVQAIVDTFVGTDGLFSPFLNDE